MEHSASYSSLFSSSGVPLNKVSYYHKNAGQDLAQ